MHIINDTKVHVRIDVFTGRITVNRYGKVYDTILVSDRKRKPNTVISNQKELQDFLNSQKSK